GCAQKEGDGHEDHEHDGNASTLDETLSYDSAVADNGFQVTGGVAGTATALTGGAEGSATSLKAVDVSPDDATGATDLADFLLDAKEADGGRIQAELRSLTTANASGLSGDFLGGVAHNVDVFGASGIGPADLPDAKAYVLLQGLARVKADGATLDDLQLVQVAVSQGIRGADGALLAAHDDDLEIHVLFPGSLLEGNAVFPGSDEGFLYYFFENVKLELLAPEAKATVGSRLAAPQMPNEAPVAAAAVMLNNASVVSADFDPDMVWLNVTLDASNSTDTDGKIEAYSWDVKEFNATGALIPLNKTSGAVANFSFTSGGTKIISLRIIDEDGGIANTTMFFFVNTNKLYGFDFGDENPLNDVGASPDCQAALNCFIHSVTVFWGAQRLTTTALTTSGECIEPHQDLYLPGESSTGMDTPMQSQDGLNVTAAELTAVGKYGLEVWFEAQAQCNYSFTLAVSYAPDAAATES
ncbi:MAG TPA: hypothetical protein VGB18_06825, partial [Candidatus Thermoplasmatota archaeon]